MIGFPSSAGLFHVAAGVCIPCDGQYMNQMNANPYAQGLMGQQQAQMQQQASNQQWERANYEAMAQKQPAPKVQSSSRPVPYPLPTRSPKELNVKDNILPDISLTRVLKWAVVVVVALALGRKVWDSVGAKATEHLTKALKDVVGSV